MRGVGWGGACFVSLCTLSTQHKGGDGSPTEGLYMETMANVYSGPLVGVRGALAGIAKCLLNRVP